jgi:hypothetical protein
MRLPLPIVAEVAPGADPSAPPADWNFTSEGIRWRTKAGIEITLGRDDEDDEAKPGSCELTFDDRDGRLSPRNVLGPWYGEIDKNTPMRILLDIAYDRFTRVRASGWGTEPESGKAWLHSNSSFWSTDGSYGYVNLAASNSAQYAILSGPVGTEVDIVHVAAVPVMPTGGAWVDATVVRRIDGNNHYRLHTEFQPDGTIRVKIVRILNGVSTELVGLTDTGVTYTAGQEIATHVQAAGKVLQIRCWRVGIDAEPTVWHARVSDTAVMGYTCGLYQWRLATNAGSFGARFDNFQVRTNLYTGQVPEWPVRWPDRSGADCVAPIAASGILRWLGQGQPPLTSPISQQLAAYNAQAYWRLEDGPETTAPGSALPRPRGVPASVVDATPGTDDAPPGALSAVSLNTTGSSRLTGRVSSWSTGNGFAVLVYARFPQLPAASPAMPFLEVQAGGTVNRWVVTADAATFNMSGLNNNGDELTSTGGVFYGIDPTKWFAFRLLVTQVGSSINYSMTWHPVGSPTYLGMDATRASSTVTRPTQIIVAAPTDGTLVTQLWAGAPSVPFYSQAFMKVSAGYAGETDVERIARVLGNANIEVVVEPGEGVPLGPQPRNATPLEVARDAETAGFGLLYERGATLGYIPYSARINVPVAMALDWNAGHLAVAPEPVDDDLDLINRWTSKRPEGSERTAENADSIARHRAYEDGGEANVFADDQLADDAGWHVAIGSRDVMRWPRIVIDLVRNQSLIATWLGCRVGSRITIANLPDQVAGEVADLIIVGYQQSIGKHRWRVELTCVPAVPWVEVATWGESVGDSTSTVLAEPLDATETAIDITSKWYEDTWYAAGGYVWRVNGEPMTVTSVTAPVGAPGAYTQTATVVRSPTLAKAHAAGKAVRLMNPGRWGIRH